MREGLPGQHVGLAVDAALLALEDPRGGDRREAHAVADDQDDVLGPVGVALLGQDPLHLRLRLLEVGVVALHELGVRGARLNGEREPARTRQNRDSPICRCIRGSSVFLRVAARPAGCADTP